MANPYKTMKFRGIYHGGNDPYNAMVTWAKQIHGKSDSHPAFGYTTDSITNAYLSGMLGMPVGAARDIRILGRVVLCNSLAQYLRTGISPYTLEEINKLKNRDTQLYHATNNKKLLTLGRGL